MHGSIITRLKSAFVGYLALLLVGVALCVAIKIAASQAYDTARRHYLQAAQSDADAASRHVRELAEGNL